jgi:hypothetical protein
MEPLPSRLLFADKVARRAMVHRLVGGAFRMRTTAFLVAVSVIAAMTLAAAAQQAGQPSAPAPKVEPETAVAKAARTPRISRARRHRITYAGRSYIPGSPADICRVMNGWRAFRNRRDPRGYFYTGRVACYR